jgi:hypothetical protein
MPKRRWSLPAVLLLVVEACEGFVPSPERLPTIQQGQNQNGPRSVLSPALGSAVADGDLTITVPPFMPVDDSYPSVLHKIHVKRILSEEEAAHCLSLATRYAQSTGCWDRPDTARHASYATCDFAVEVCHTLTAYLEEIDFDGRIWDQLSSLYGINYEDMSYLDLFCAHYSGNKGNSGHGMSMDRLIAHRDGSLLSFTVTLNDPSDFEGGGTFFDALRDVDPMDGILLPNGVVRPRRAGDGVLHSGKLLHGGDVVLSGNRTVLVGFIDVSSWLCRPGVLGNACRDWGRMDVAAFRWKRQQKMTQNGARKSWPQSYAQWLPRTLHDSFVRGIVPAFESVGRRAEAAFQRKRRLEVEDLLLRSILLPESDVPYVMLGDDSFHDGDISILA